jgi:hypothetical protein
VPGYSQQSTTKAWPLREHASDRAKFFIDANYQILATGNLELARQTCEAWARAYPRGAVALTQQLERTPVLHREHDSVEGGQRLGER